MADQPGPSKKFKLVEQVSVLDPKFEETCSNWYEEENNDFSDQDDANVETNEFSEHDTDSEFEMD